MKSLFAIAAVAAALLTCAPAFADTPATKASLPINIPAAGTVQLVPASPTEALYVTHFDFLSPAPGTLTFVAGGGVNCSVSQIPVAGPYPTQQGLSAGSGFGAVMVIPIGDALCAIVTTPVGGLIAFDQL